MASVTVGAVLLAWRAAICFGEEVCLEDGRKGTVCGKSETGKMVVITGPRVLGERERIETMPSKLFPAWWPREQFPAG